MINVLLISLDTLRADVAYSGRFPVIERVRKRGITFTSAVATAPLTPPSHASILTGLWPTRHGIRHLLKEQLAPSARTLAEILRSSGWTTGAVVACPGLNRWYGLGRGFDHYDDEIPALPDGRNALDVIDVKLRGQALKRAPLVVDRAIEWLTGIARPPYFLFVHFFDSHWPYQPPEDVGVSVNNAYEGEVAYMDRELGRLLDWFDTHGEAEDLLTVLLSDHGEDLAGYYPNDHAGGRGHPEEQGHGCLLFDATQLVPLIVCHPDQLGAGRTIAPQVRLIDVMPTILDLIGYPIPQNIDGASLRPLWEGREVRSRPAYFETFFREELAAGNQAFGDLRPLAGVRLDNRWKVIWDVAAGVEGVRVYDLEHDPDERRPRLVTGTRANAVPRSSSMKGSG